MRDVLFTLSVKKKPFFIVLAMFTVVLVIAGIVLSVVRISLGITVNGAAAFLQRTA